MKEDNGKPYDNNNDEISKSRRAFLEIEEFRRTHPFPKDFDPEQAREEAMREKYGKYFS